MFYQIVREKESLMMCYVILTKNNKLIVIDGGIDGTGLNADVYLLDKLREISGLYHPVIDAWFFTHIHNDHVNEFIKMVNNHKEEFSVKSFYFNFPKRDFVMKYGSESELSWFDKFTESFNAYAGESDAYDKYRRIQKGDTIDIDDVHFEVLQTPDETEISNCINNSSIVLKMIYMDKSILFLGDLGIEGGNRLLNDYGNYLKSDFVQMAHHGQNGVTKKVYETINPSVCLWPTPIWVWENRGKDGTEGNGPYQTTAVRGWMYNDLGITEHYVSGLDGTLKVI